MGRTILSMAIAAALAMPLSMAGEILVAPHAMTAQAEPHSKDRRKCHKHWTWKKFKYESHCHCHEYIPSNLRSAVGC